MRRLVVILMIAIVALSAVGKSLTVYSVTGEVKKRVNGKWVVLVSGNTLRQGDVVSVGEESALTVLDEDNCKMIYLTERGRKSVKEWVKGAAGSKSLTRQYVSYLCRQLVNVGSTKMSHPDTYMQATATVYRSLSTDSLLLWSVSHALSACDEVPHSDLDVTFDLVTSVDNVTVNREVTGDTGCYVRVCNNAAEHVYVNVLNIDTEGNKYLVLPVDELSLCAHLLVPPHTTVAFKSEPFVFENETGEESFLLIATREPVDFSVLMNPFTEGDGKKIDTGLSRKTIIVNKL